MNTSVKFSLFRAVFNRPNRVHLRISTLANMIPAPSIPRPSFKPINTLRTVSTASATNSTHLLLKPDSKQHSENVIEFGANYPAMLEDEDLDNYVLETSVVDLHSIQPALAAEKKRKPKGTLKKVVEHGEKDANVFGLGDIDLDNFITELSDVDVHSIQSSTERKKKFESRKKKLKEVVKQLSPEAKAKIIPHIPALMNPVNKNHAPCMLEPSICRKLITMMGDVTDPSTTVIVCDPGPGILTSEFVKHGTGNLHVLESNKEFFQHLTDFHSNGHNCVTLSSGHLTVPFEHIQNDHKSPLDRILQSEQIACVKIVMIVNQRLTVHSLLRNFILGLSPYDDKNVEFYFVISSSTSEIFLKKPNYTFGHYLPQQWNLFMENEMVGELSSATFFPQFSKISKDKEVFVVRSTIRQTLGKTNFILSAGERALLAAYSCNFPSSSTNYVLESLEKWSPGIGYHLIAEGFKVFTRFRDLSTDDYLSIFSIFLKFTNTSSIWQILLLQKGAEAPIESNVLSI